MKWTKNSHPRTKPRLTAACRICGKPARHTLCPRCASALITGGTIDGLKKELGK